MHRTTAAIVQRSSTNAPATSARRNIPALPASSSTTATAALRSPSAALAIRPQESRSSSAGCAPPRSTCCRVASGLTRYLSALAVMLLPAIVCAQDLARDQQYCAALLDKYLRYAGVT